MSGAVRLKSWRSLSRRRSWNMSWSSINTVNLITREPHRWTLHFVINSNRNVHQNARCVKNSLRLGSNPFLLGSKIWLPSSMDTKNKKTSSQTKLIEAGSISRMWIAQSSDGGIPEWRMQLQELEIPWRQKLKHTQTQFRNIRHNWVVCNVLRIGVPLVCLFFFLKHMRVEQGTYWCDCAFNGCGICSVRDSMRSKETEQGLKLVVGMQELSTTPSTRLGWHNKLRIID